MLGGNNAGQLGDGTKEQRETPTAVDTELDFQSIVAGGNVTCGLSNHEAYCWGANALGEIGDGTDEERLTAVQVQFP